MLRLNDDLNALEGSLPPGKLDVLLAVKTERGGLLTDSLLSWKKHVRRFGAEVEQAFHGSHDVFGGDDYIAALLVRERIQDALSKINDDDLRGKVSEWVETVDRDFMDLTVEDSDAVVARRAAAILGRECGSSWWWARLPRQGPVRQDLFSNEGPARHARALRHRRARGQ